MRVFIAEDDEVSRRILDRTLSKWGYDVEAASDGAAAWEALRQADAPKLAILDWMMPGVDGPDLCRRLRARADAPYVYIILLTARTQKADLVLGLEAGADDYITKPFDMHELEARLRAGRRLLELQSELIAAQEALRIQATRDPLTGILNHGAILDMLRDELDRATRERTSVGVIVADLDHFKDVNDTYGHMAGDAVLREAARRMTEAVRSYDAVGRYGGEEFLIVVAGADAERALKSAERVRQHVSDGPVVTPEASISIAVSLGAATSTEGRRADVTALIQAADRALYEAKRSGRNRAVLADGSGIAA